MCNATKMSCWPCANVVGPERWAEPSCCTRECLVNRVHSPPANFIFIDSTTGNWGLTIVDAKVVAKNRLWFYTSP